MMDTSVRYVNTHQKKNNYFIYLYAIIEQGCSLLSYKFTQLFFKWCISLFYIIRLSYENLLGAKYCDLIVFGKFTFFWRGKKLGGMVRDVSILI